MYIPVLRTQVTFLNHYVWGTGYSASGSYQSIQYCKQELYTSGGTYIGYAYADSNGIVNWGNIGTGSFQVKATAIDSNGQCIWNTYSQMYMTPKSPVFYYDGTSMMTYTYQLPHTDTNHLFCCFNYIEKAKHWFMSNVPGWTPLTVSVTVPTSEWKFYRVSGYINLGSISGWPTDFFLPGKTIHEYAHSLMWWGRDGDLPGNPMSDHYLDTEYGAGPLKNWGGAFTEGWSDFMVKTIVVEPCGFGFGDDIETGLTYCGLLFANSTVHGGNAGDWDGWDVEGACAAILNDMIDPVNAGDHPGYSPTGDLLAKPFSDLWTIIAIDEPDDMWGVYLDAVNRFSPSEDTAMYYLCYNALADYLNNYDT